MNHEQRMYRDIINNKFSKPRCQYCKHYKPGENNTEFCGLLWPNPNDCYLIQEELKLKGRK